MCLIRRTSGRHFLKKDVIHKNDHPDTYGDIRNIERGPAPPPEIEGEKIHYGSESDSIDKIADGTAEYQSKSGGKHAVAVGCFFVKIKNKDQGQR